MKHKKIIGKHCSFAMGGGGAMLPRGLKLSQNILFAEVISKNPSPAFLPIFFPICLAVPHFQ